MAEKVKRIRLNGAAAQKDLMSLPGRDVHLEQQVGFAFRELKPPAQMKVSYMLRGEEVTKEIVIRRLWPQCLEDANGWHKPYWCLTGWEMPEVSQ